MTISRIRAKLAQARGAIEAAGMYQETVDRLLAESSKLITEAGKLIEGEYANYEQGQRTTPQSSNALEALPGRVPSDASQPVQRPEQGGKAEPSA